MELLDTLVMSRIDILVLDGESFFALKVVRALAQVRRWRIHVLAKTTTKRRPFIEWSRHVTEFRQVHVADEHAYLREIEKVTSRVGAKVILPVTEDGVLFCIRHQKALERMAALPPMPSEAAFRTAIDKGSLALFMAGHGIPHPKTKLGGSGSYEELRFPVLVKPRRDCNGRGIVKVESLAELSAELSRRKNLNEVCVQEFVDGSDWGCSLLAKDGEILAWTTQLGLRRTGAFSFFDEVSVEVSEPIREIATRLVHALRWSGVAHIDLRVDAWTGEARVLEINGRFWASITASMLAGVNFADVTAQCALGQTAQSHPVRDIHFIHAKSWLRGFRPLGGSLRSDIWSLSSDPFPEIKFRLDREKNQMPAIGPHLAGVRVV